MVNRVFCCFCYGSGSDEKAPLNYYRYEIPYCSYELLRNSGFSLVRVRTDNSLFSGLKRIMITSYWFHNPEHVH